MSPSPRKRGPKPASEHDERSAWKVEGSVGFLSRLKRAHVRIYCNHDVDDVRRPGCSQMLPIYVELCAKELQSYLDDKDWKVVTNPETDMLEAYCNKHEPARKLEPVEFIEPFEV